MAANYRVHLTATAEKDYQTFYEEAEADIDSGEPDSHRVSLLKSIEKAIDETLSVSPIKPELTLAGCLFFVYMLNLGSICIYYIAYAEHGDTFILHIGPNQEGNDLSGLQEAVINGEAEAERLLETFGIEKTYLLKDRPKVWIN
jgi:hypothetical protein